MSQGWFVSLGLSTSQTGLQWDICPIEKCDSAWVLTAIAGHSRSLIFHLEVIIPLLNSKTQEKVFVEQLRGFGEVGLEELVSLLDRALCGANQSPHCWHEDREMTIYNFEGFETSKAYYLLYFAEDDGLIDSAVYRYVDDIYLTGDHTKKINRTGANIQVKMQDVGVRPCVSCLWVWLSQDARFECHLPFISMSRVLLHRGRRHHDTGDKHNLTSWRMWHGGMQPCKDSHACRFKNYCRHRNSPHQCCKSPTPGGKINLL